MKIGEQSKTIIENGRYLTLLEMPEMNDKEFDEIKIIMELSGGAWNERHKAFVFLDTYKRVQNKISKYVENEDFEIPDFRQFQFETQFYPTPEWLAKEVVESCNILENDVVLEPSAGRGALLNHIKQKTEFITAIEFNSENARALRESGYIVTNDSFENVINNNKLYYNRVVMAPPFAQRMDITHTILAYNEMQIGGRLISIVSENSLYYEDGISETFRLFLKFTNANIKAIPIGTYIDTGTNIAVSVITINKACDIKFVI